MTDGNQRNREALSALMDSESHELELRRTLKTLSGDKELADTWHRYQLAAAAMRRELPPRMTDLSSRISAAIEQEPSLKPSLNRYLQPLGKVAVAASVALVAVLGFRQMQFQGPAAVPEVADTTATAPASTGLDGPQFQLPAGYDLPAVSARTVSTGPAVASDPRPVIIVKQAQPEVLVDRQGLENYLNWFMVQHTDRAALSAGQGALPYARLPQEVVNE